MLTVLIIAKQASLCWPVAFAWSSFGRLLLYQTIFVYDHESNYFHLQHAWCFWWDAPISTILWHVYSAWVILRIVLSKCEFEFNISSKVMPKYLTSPSNGFVTPLKVVPDFQISFPGDDFVRVGAISSLAYQRSVIVRKIWRTFNINS